MDTYLRHIDEVPRRSLGYRDVPKSDWFDGATEAQLGKRVGITQFGVNHVALAPGAYSSLRHWHEAEDEFLYVLAGELVLIDDNGERSDRGWQLRGLSGRTSQRPPCCQPDRRAGHLPCDGNPKGQVGACPLSG